MHSDTNICMHYWPTGSSCGMPAGQHWTREPFSGLQTLSRGSSFAHCLLLKIISSCCLSSAVIILPIPPTRLLFYPLFCGRYFRPFSFYSKPYEKLIPQSSRLNQFVYRLPIYCKIYFDFITFNSYFLFWSLYFIC